MEKTLSDLFFELVSRYGLMTACGISAIVLSLAFNGSMIVRFIIDMCKRKWPSEKKLVLTEHTCFIDLDNILNHRLLHLNIRCSIRKKLYYDIMSTRITCLKEELLKLVQSDVNAMSQKELCYKIDWMLDDANKNASTKLVANGVPQFILDMMDEKVTFAYTFYHKQLKNYCYNHYLYSSNVERVWAVLEVIPVSLECYMNILESALSEFNGDIKALNYGGTTCQNCKVCVHEEYLKSLQQIE